jgi:hypothetical protein
MLFRHLVSLTLGNNPMERLGHLVGPGAPPADPPQPGTDPELPEPPPREPSPIDPDPYPDYRDVPPVTPVDHSRYQ